MSRAYTRRQMCQLGIGGLAGMSLLGLAGCGGSATGNGTTRLNFIFWGSAARDELTRKAIKLFEQANPNIKISSQFLPFDQYWNKLNTQIAGNNIPDLIQMEMRYLIQYNQKKLLYDLTPFTSDGTLDLKSFDTVVLANGKIDSKIYGVPLGVSFVCNTYNVDLLKETGVGDPPTDMTWDDYAEFSRKLTAKLPDGAFGSNNPVDLINYFEVWVRQRGHELYAANGKIGFTKEDVVTWFDYWKELVASKGAIPLDTQISIASGGGPSDNPIVQRKTVMNISLGNFLESTQKLTKDKLALLPPPYGPQPGIYIKPTMLLSVSQKCKNPQEAAKFVNFFVNDEGAVKALGLDRGVPGSAKAREILSPVLTDPQKEFIRLNNELTKSPQVKPVLTLPPPGAGQLEPDFQRAAQSVFLDKKSSSDAADAFLADAQKALSQG